MEKKAVNRNGPRARRSVPRLRRAYFESRYGQLHVHNAIPAGGGFDEGTTLVCVHGVGETGRVFVPLMAHMGAERSIYAPDLPGCGESDPAAQPPTLESGAAAVQDFVEQMRLRAIDLLGVGSGAAIARAFALRRPEVVRRLILVNAESREPPVRQPVLELRALVSSDPSALRSVEEFLA